MLGTYYFKYAVRVYPELQLAPYNIRVEIVGQTDKRYRIKYLQQHPNGAKPGSLHWVQKTKVKTIEAAPVINIRLPYKD